MKADMEGTEIYTPIEYILSKNPLIDGYPRFLFLLVNYFNNQN
jgi:hypothetical protein